MAEQKNRLMIVSLNVMVFFAFVVGGGLAFRWLALDYPTIFETYLPVVVFVWVVWGTLLWRLLEAIKKADRRNNNGNS